MTDPVKKVRKLLRTSVLWLSLALIGVLAVPTAVLAVLLAGVSMLADKIVVALESNG